MNEITLILHPQELAATVEALYDALMQRMKWTLRRDERKTPEGWPSVDYQTAQDLINQTASSLAKGMMALRELEDLHPEFEEMFSPSTDMWDLINEVTLATEWDHAPLHASHPEERKCPVCRDLAGV